MFRTTWWQVSKGRLNAFIVAAALVSSCHRGGSTTDEGKPAAEGFVRVDGSVMQSGFARGTLRRSHAVAPFQIQKRPVTWAEFDGCVATKRCSAADSPSCAAGANTGYAGYRAAPYAEKADESPALCVGEAQAEAYCHAIGGRLPTLDEWLLAARGPAPQRFSWGDAPTACDQHPLSADLLDRQTSSAPAAGASCAGAGAPLDAEALAVGQHPMGASPFGVEDVLLAPGELLANDREGLYRTCTSAGSHCVVHGMDPGAIDAASPFYKTKTFDAAGKPSERSVVNHPYSFRCVLDADAEVAQ